LSLRANLSPPNPAPTITTFISLRFAPQIYTIFSIY